MFTAHFPNFQKGRILKREMLENLRDFPRDFLDLYFQEYSNGIITGVNILVNGTTLIVTKGIVKQNNRLYILHGDYVLPYFPTGKETVLKIRFSEELNGPDFTTFSSEIMLGDLDELADNELELARFKLKPGANLRDDYIDFADFATEFNTINVIHCQYAGLYRSTFHPMILHYFAREVLKNKPSNAYDISFALECLNHERIQKEVIDYYVSNRLGLEHKEYTNLEIHKYLGRILLEVQSGVRMAAHNPGRPKRLIVD